MSDFDDSEYSTEKGNDPLTRLRCAIPGFAELFD